MDFETFTNLENNQQQLYYNELHNNIEILKQENKENEDQRNSLSIENEKLFEISLNSIPVKKKIELEEKIKFLQEELNSKELDFQNVSNNYNQISLQFQKIQDNFKNEKDEY